MRVEVLGPLRVLDDDGSAVRLAGERPRALLIRLALDLGRIVGIERLIEDLWDAAPPPTARQSLHVHLSTLRKAVGADRIVTEVSGYRLALDAADLDVADFERLVRQARGAAADPQRAATLYQEALSLWRGSPLADVAHLEFGRLEGARLEEARLAAVEQRIEADLACGRHADLVAELDALTAGYPLREGLWRLRMLALYRCGRQADALRAYQDVRRILDDELGIEPGPELRALQAAVLNQDRDLTLGAELVSSGAVPSPRPAPTSTAGLPVQRTSFVGRAREVEELSALLRSAQLVTVTGPGGSGKTRLAYETAAAVAADFADGVRVVGLAAVESGDHVIVRMAAALGVAEQAGQSLAETVVAWLGARELLLVVDNCEHLRAEVAALFDVILNDCPGLRLLATSRAGVGVAGEQLYRLSPLAVPGPDATPSEVRGSDAAQLFAERALLVDPAFRVDEQTAPAVAAICRKLDGVPLAIEMAAARLRSLRVGDIAVRLDDLLGLDSTSGRGSGPHRETLRAVVDWSVGLLDRAARIAFRRLAVFVGGCTLDAAEEVCGWGELDAAQLVDLIDRLVEHSLLQLDAEGRYAMLGVVRQRAAEMLAQADEEAETRLRHFAWVMRYDESLRGLDLRVRRARIEAEEDNVIAAMAWMLDSRFAGTPALPQSALSTWGARGRTAAAIAWLVDALRQFPDGYAEWRVAALVELARQYVSQYDLEAAGEVIELGQRLARSLAADPAARYRLEALDAERRLRAGEDDAAADLKRVVTEAGGALDMAERSRWIALHAWAAADPDDVVAAGTEAVALSAALGDSNSEGIGLQLLALGRFAKGETRAAERALDQAHEIYRRLRDEDNEARILCARAAHLVWRGDFDPAVRELELAHELFRRAGNDLLADDAACSLAWLTGRAGDLRTAHAWFARVSEAEPTAAVLRLARAECRIGVGQLAAVRRELGQMLEEDGGGTPWAVTLRTRLSALAVIQGDGKAAREALADAAHAVVPTTLTANEVVLAASGVALAADQPDLAVRLAAAARVAGRLSSPLLFEIAYLVRALEETIGVEEYAVREAEGATWTTADALEKARLLAAG